jgi:hypothetical protein
MMFCNKLLHTTINNVQPLEQEKTLAARIWAFTGLTFILTFFAFPQHPCTNKTTTEHLHAATSSCYLMSASARIPELAVFDLDDCLWTPEMYTLCEVPTVNDGIIGNLGDCGKGIVAVKSGNYTVRLFPDALLILQKIYMGEYTKMRIAAASSADTPLAVRIGRASMSLLEVVPGVTVREVFDRGWPDDFEAHLQIGRSPPLTSNKSINLKPISPSFGGKLIFHMIV